MKPSRFDWVIAWSVAALPVVLGVGILVSGCSSPDLVNAERGRRLDNEIASMGSAAGCDGDPVTCPRCGAPVPLGCKRRTPAEVARIATSVTVMQKTRAEGWRP